MLQRDYFIRLIQEFMAAIGRFLQKDIDQRTDEDLIDIYRQYVGDYRTLRNLTVEEAIEYSRNEWKPGEQLRKLEMLAELWYAESTFKLHPLKDMLLEKAFRLLDFVDTHSTDLSLMRREHIREVKELLDNNRTKKLTE